MYLLSQLLEFILVKEYYRLVKPGIIYGNLITVIAGFVLGSKYKIDYSYLVIVLLAISLVIASGCVFNNLFDQDIDKLMKRTQNRELVLGKIKSLHAFIYALVLGILGFVVLINVTNYLTVLVAFVGIFVYVVLYTFYFKRNSVHGTLIGSISGAVPILVGYTASSQQFGLGGLLLLLILSFWQMPHSYAINIRLINDYKNAKINVMPVLYGIKATKIVMIVYAFLFLLSVLSLYYFGFVGKIYLYMMLIFSIIWLLICIYMLFSNNDKKNATYVFMYSIFIIILFSLLVITNSFHSFG
jgi:protoheme IX farnesyltransferase